MEVSNGSAVRRSFICTANAKNIFKMNVQTGLDRSLNGQMRETMSSLQIAEVSGRPHNDVLKAIRAMEPAWIKVNGGNFSLIKYTDSRGRQKPCYQLTKTECLYIATKFNNEARACLVLRWEELENQQRMDMMRELVNSKKMCIFVVLKDSSYTYFAEQAVKLLNTYIGLFYCPIVRYWRLPIRKIKMLTLRSGYYHLSAAYMAAAFSLPITI